MRLCRDSTLLPAFAQFICSFSRSGHVPRIYDFIVPYSGYGLFFLLRVLAEHFLGLASVEQLCERFSITRNQFYKWLKLWRSQKEEWLSLPLFRPATRLGDGPSPDSPFMM